MYWDGKYHQAHRLSWTLFRSKLSAEDVVTRICESRSCVSPDHLVLKGSPGWLESQCAVQPNGCWVWRNRCNAGGYGRFIVGGKDYLAHRFSFELFKGEIPKGMGALHTCDNPPCVNPEHIYAGAAKQNTCDMLSKGREAWGDRAGSGKLSADQVRAAFDMRRNGLLQREIADRLGVTQSSVSRLLSKQSWRRLHDL